MAKILYRAQLTPVEPAAVQAGSVAKGAPLTNAEGDWNYKALNDDIAARAPLAGATFTGAVTAPSLSLTAALPITSGGTGSSTASGARTNLGLGTAATMTGPSGAIVGTTDTQQLQNKTLTLSTWQGNAVAVAYGGTGATDAANARINLGLGSAATMTGPSGVIVGTTDVQTLTNKTWQGNAIAVLYGGTGATDAANARTNLSVPQTTGGGASGTWGISITGNSANVTATVAIANGGTGQTTAAGAVNSLDRGQSLRESNGGTMVVGGNYMMQTGGGAITMYLPQKASTSVGDKIYITNMFTTWGTNNFTIAVPANTYLNYLTENMVCDVNVAGLTLTCEYTDATNAYWRVSSSI